ncbi:MAG: LysM peptidoglycan-binding domain-containing protein [Acidobacteriota bacterium]
MTKHGRYLLALVAAAPLCLGAEPTTGLGAPGQGGTAASAVDADRYSKSFVGGYRNLLEIDDQIERHCKTYGVDPAWARAICLYESGGNPDLNSGVGAEGYFQVMPRTYRGLGVTTNVEAGIKYLAEMFERYGREDYATAAYNGGPLFVDKDRAFKLETLQYVIGVGTYREILRQHESNVRALAQRLKIHHVKPGDTWWSISQETGIPIVELRQYNPFLAHREELKEGNRIVHPEKPGSPNFVYRDGILSYRTRIGDNPFTVPFVFGVPLDDFRKNNGIWRLQSLPDGTQLSVDLRRGTDFKDYQVSPGDTLLALAGGSPENVWDFIHDSGAFDQELSAGRSLRIWLGTTSPAITPAAAPSTPSLELDGSKRATFPPAKPPAPPKPDAVVYSVKRGDSLSTIARAFGVTTDDLRRMNGLRKRAVLTPGQKIKIPPTGVGG